MGNYLHVTEKNVLVRYILESFPVGNWFGAIKQLIYTR